MQSNKPSIHPNERTRQRVLLLDHDQDSGLIRVRQYSILVQPSGVSKNLKALLRRRGLPDLGGCADVADFLTRSGYGSESEGEDAETSRVELDQDMGRGNVAARQSRVRLHEVGPRLTLELVKIEDGLCAGDVLFHAHVDKDPAEAAALRDEHEERERLRRQRRAEQVREPWRRKQAAVRFGGVGHSRAALGVAVGSTVSWGRAGPGGVPPNRAAHICAGVGDQADTRIEAAFSDAARPPLPTRLPNPPGPVRRRRTWPEKPRRPSGRRS